MFIPRPLWDGHANDIIGMDAPEMHPDRLMTMEMVAAAIGVTPASLLEYLRRGACPGPPVRIGRTPAWTRPIVEQWTLARSGRPQMVECTGCRRPTEMFGLQVAKVDGDIGCVPVCVECEQRLMPLLNSWDYATKGQLTVAAVVALLQTEG
jgi:predicted DNA-binding transcriptional regulator AlpA